MELLHYTRYQQSDQVICLHCLKDIRFWIATKVSEKKEAIEKLREEAGCFVLLTNVPAEEKESFSQNLQGAGRDREKLRLLEGFPRCQRRIPQNASTIEAMGLVLVLSLLLWRLMERTMRRKAKEEHLRLQGWNNADTLKPTSFMMASKLSPSSSA